MSKSNKSVRQLMEKKYGKRCMIEAAGIRKIPVSERKKIKGYRRTQEQLTYHHILEKSNGGPATEENGAVIKEYNHAWLHRLPEDQKQIINRKLQEYKMTFVELKATDRGLETEAHEIPIELDLSDCIEIPLYDNTKEDNQKRQKFNRAKVKEEFRRRIEEDLEDLDDLELY